MSEWDELVRERDMWRSMNERERDLPSRKVAMFLAIVCVGGMVGFVVSFFL